MDAKKPYPEVGDSFRWTRGERYYDDHTMKVFKIVEMEGSGTRIWASSPDFFNGTKSFLYSETFISSPDDWDLVDPEAEPSI